MKKNAILILSVMLIVIIPNVAHAQCHPEISGLLDRIERAGAELKSFQAEMTFRQEQMLVETLTIRNGTLYYQTDGKTVRARIHFRDFCQRDLEDPSSAKTIKFDEDYAFDGLWLTRRNGRTKSIQMWEVSKTSYNSEAFRLGKGPFPLPFAIKKHDVLEHFDVTIAEPDAKNDLRNTHHLKLKPKKKSSYAKEYVQMELWVSTKTALPVQIRFEKDDFEITTVTWLKPQVGRKLKDSVFKLKSPGRGWDIEKHPLKEKEPEKQTSEK